MEFKLPEIGEGVHEGELIRWLVKDGDTVAADQALIEVMTDKATVEVPAPTAGKITGISAKEGQMIKVGQTLAQIEAGAGGAKEAPKEEAKAEAPKAPASNGTAIPPQGASRYENGGSTGDTGAAEGGGTGPKTQAPQQQASQPQATSASLAAASPGTAKPSAGAGQGGGGGGAVAQTSVAAAEQTQGGGASVYQGALESHSANSVPAAPIVRAMAQKAGVDLASVQGSGPDVGGRNRVLEEDLIKYLQNKELGNGSGSNGAKAGSSTWGAPTSEETERKPLRGIRRAISNAMVKSKFTAPHYSYVDEFECSELFDLRERAKVSAEKQGVKFSYLPFIVKAVVSALKEYPQVNASLEDGPDGQTLVLKKFYHIGIAVNTKDGLLVPVIKNADRKTLIEIARELNELSEKTRNGKASGDELKGSTFTITSMGNVGGLFATPIINYPEVGIMGVYRIQEKPIVKDGQIVIGKTMHLSLSLDHRVVDGVVGAEFCNAVIAGLTNPARLMLEMI